MPLERVQKILAQAGIASRRRAEELVTEGLVTINGKVAKLGDKAEAGKDSIKVRGQLITHKEPPTYIAFFKPTKVISALSDPQGRPALHDYFAKLKIRVYPIGRLDFMTEGLLLLTNDGALAEKIQKSTDLARVYHVKVKGHPGADDLERLGRGMRIEGKSIKPHSVRIAGKGASKDKIEVVFLGGGAVDVKTYFEMKGFLVSRITRVAIGQVQLGDLAPGKFRMLTKSQMEAIILQPELGLRRIEEEAERLQAKKIQPGFEVRGPRQARPPRGPRAGGPIIKPRSATPGGASAESRSRAPTSARPRKLGGPGVFLPREGSRTPSPRRRTRPPGRG